MEDELDRYAGHEVLRAILDQGCDPKEYGRHYEARLRQAELESIEDYLSESDNLVTLHQQVRMNRGKPQLSSCVHTAWIVMWDTVILFLVGALLDMKQVMGLDEH